MQVHFERAPPRANVTLCEGPERTDHARIVDQQIDRSQRVLDVGEGAIDRRRIGHVGRKGARLAARSLDQRHGLGKLRFRARHDGDGIAGRRQRLGKGAAQPAATAGYDRDLHDALTASRTLASCRAQVRCAIFAIVFVVATTWQVHMTREHGFAARLREWRQRRGWSQLDLAARADISQRHLSFLELATRRAQPRHGAPPGGALDIPLRQHNALLLAAGFAPVWQETDLGAPELADVRHALDYILAQQEPFPAVAVDRHWNLLKANDGAVRLVEFLVGPLAPDAKVNLADALVGPDVLRPYLLNWADVVGYFIRSVEADAAADGRAETAALLERLLAYEGVRPLLKAAATGAAAGPVLPMHFRKGEVSLQLFTTIATLGTPQDITLQELRIESFFPMNRETALVLRGWAAKK